jgi:hypothetical protein
MENNRANTYHQIELPLEIESISSSESTEIHKLLLECSEKYDRQQQQLENLLHGQMEIIATIYSQDFPDPTAAILAITKDINTLGKGIVGFHKQLEKNNLSQDLNALKSEQQKIKAVLENQEKRKNSLGYLNWKQAAMMILVTALISSLSSLAIVQLFWNNKPNQPPEKPLKPKVKSTSNR